MHLAPVAIAASTDDKCEEPARPFEWPQGYVANTKRNVLPLSDLFLNNSQPMSVAYLEKLNPGQLLAAEQGRGAKPWRSPSTRERLFVNLVIGPNIFVRQCRVIRSARMMAVKARFRR